MMYIWIVHDLRTLQKSIAKRTPTCDEAKSDKPSVVPVCLVPP